MTARRRKDYLRIGVTGGIGSGKSIVCSVFQTIGRTVISADGIARDIVETDTMTRDGIRDAFGSTIFSQDGVLDRKTLASIVFSDKRKKKILESLVHPVVFERLEFAIQQLSPGQRSPYVVIEAALVFESGMDKDLDYTIVVDADEEMRIQRIMKRDGLQRPQILQRMSSQMDAKKKARLADFTIVNVGHESELVEKVKFVDRLLTTMQRM